MKNIKSFGSQQSTTVLNLSKYQHNIMLSEITSDYRHQQNTIKYLDIFFVIIGHPYYQHHVDTALHLE